MKGNQIPIKSKTKWPRWACLVVMLLLTYWLVKPQKTCLTFLENEKPLAGVKLAVAISNNLQNLNGKTLISNAQGQICVPMPAESGLSVVSVTTSDGRSVNKDLVIPPVSHVAWSFKKASHGWTIQREPNAFSAFKKKLLSVWF